MDTIKIKFKKLNDSAKIPTKGSDGAAAFDLYAISCNIVNESEYGYVEYGTGLTVEIPDGYVGKIYPRSSISKTGMILSNSVGIIDSDYRGEIRFRFKMIPGSAMYYVGDRIGQMLIEKVIPVEWIEVSELNESNRGTGGFGSTGK